MSAVATYEPKPGSVADRALAHMALLFKGSEITSSMLAQAIGIEAKQLQGSLQAALEHGAIFARQKGGHAKSPMFWSLVDHSKKDPKGLAGAARGPETAEETTERGSLAPTAAANAPAAGDDAERFGEPASPGGSITPPRGSQHVLKAEAARPDATDRETPATASPVGGPMGAGQPAAAGPNGARKPGGPSHWRPNPLPTMTAHPGRSSEGETGTGRSAHESAGLQAAPQEQPVSNGKVAGSGYAAGRGESSERDEVLVGGFAPEFKPEPGPRHHEAIRVTRSVTFEGLTAHEIERVEGFVREMRAGVA